MKKIACLTFHNSSNYGAVLQTYALQEVCINMGCDYNIIDYSNSEKKKFDSLFKKNKEISYFNYVYKLLSLPYNAYKKIKFTLFSKKYLKTTKVINNHNELINLNGKYDYFICGSDQVWNSYMVRYDSAYFLAFVHNRNQKVSYAASFGISNLSNEDINFYRNMFKNFDKISVREKSGIDIVKQCSNKDATLVLDPTLLLDRTQWSNVAVNKINSRPYILVYVLRHDPIIQSFIKKLKKQTGYKVINISRSPSSIIREGSLSTPSPEEWVGLFLNASYVVTTSFHGTAFSINFNKPFFTFIKGDATTDTNSRIINILNMTRLGERLYTSLPSGEIDLSIPDFVFANRIIDNNRKTSIEFLQKSIDVL